MNNPYQPPSSAVSSPKQEVWRITHSLTALISGIFVVPIMLFGTFLIFFPDEPMAFGNARFWSSLLIGSVLSAIGIFPFKRTPLWLAAIIGVVVAMGALVAPEARELLYAT